MRPAKKEDDVKPSALHCDGLLSNGAKCLQAFMLTRRFNNQKAIRLAAQRVGWRIALTRRGQLVDLCPECEERVRKSIEAKRPLDHEGLGDIAPPEIVKP